jgi:hypothetical protein
MRIVRKKSECSQPDDDLLCGDRTADHANLKSFDDVVDDYIDWHREREKDMLQAYARIPSIYEVIRLAGLAKLPNGQVHPHHVRQYKHGESPAVRQAYEKLDAAFGDLQSCATFEQLIKTVETAVGNIRGVGEMLIYDASLAIGAKLGLEPDRVYLHRGTRDGASALGLQTDQESLSVDELPPAFNRLRPYEIEDCLCIYKVVLERLHRACK